MKETVAQRIEKSPLSSKKFVFASLWNTVWLLLIAYGIHSHLDPSVLVAMVYTAGAVQVLYIGGQSAVDAFVRKGFPQMKSKSSIETDSLAESGSF